MAQDEGVEPGAGAAEAPPPDEAGRWQTFLHGRIDRLHTDHKQTISKVNAVELRVSTLELLDKQKDERLRDGAKTFEALRKEIVRPWWQTLLLVAPGIVMMLGWAFYMGGMPSREQFEGTRRDVSDLQVRQAELQTKFETTAAQLQRTMDEVSRKLDDMRGPAASVPAAVVPARP